MLLCDTRGAINTNKDSDLTKRAVNDRPVPSENRATGTVQKVGIIQSSAVRSEMERRDGGKAVLDLSLFSWIRNTNWLLKGTGSNGDTDIHLTTFA